MKWGCRFSRQYIQLSAQREANTRSVIVSIRHSRWGIHQTRRRLVWRLRVSTAVAIVEADYWNSWQQVLGTLRRLEPTEAHYTFGELNEAGRGSMVFNAYRWVKTPACEGTVTHGC